MNHQKTGHCKKYLNIEVSIFDLLNFDEKKVLLSFHENNQQNAQIGYFGEVKTLKTLYDKIIEQQQSEIDWAHHNCKSFSLATRLI